MPLPSLSNLFKRWGSNPAVSAEKRTTEKKLPKFDQAKAALRRLEKIPSFDVLKANEVTLQCTDQNISVFYDRLIRYRDTLASREKIAPAMCFGELTTVTLDRFFTTDEGMYVSQSAIAILCRVIDEIFLMLEEERKREGDASYTERLLNKTFTSIISLEGAAAAAK